MSPVCAVNNCAKASKENPDLSFHKFPTKKEDRARRDAWARFCRRGKKWAPTSHSVICSTHFCAQDFQLNFRHQLLNSRRRAMLKEDAVPSIRKHEEKNILSPGNLHQERVYVMDGPSFCLPIEADPDSMVKADPESVVKTDPEGISPDSCIQRNGNVLIKDEN